MNNLVSGLPAARLPFSGSGRVFVCVCNPVLNSVDGIHSVKSASCIRGRIKRKEKTSLGFDLHVLLSHLG